MAYKRKGKTAKSDQSVYERMVEKVVQHIEEGKVAPWRSGIKANIAIMPPHNALSKHVYRGVNHAETMMLTMINNWSTTGFLTFKKIKELGGSVKTGESGTPLIRYYKVYKDQDGKNIKPVKGETMAEFMGRVKDVIPVPSMTAPVFNLDQTEGLEHIRDKYLAAAEALKNDNVDEEGMTPFMHMQHEIMNAFEERLKETVTLKKVLRTGPPCYMPTLHEIRQVDLSLYKDLSYYAEDTLHESGHSTMWETKRIKSKEELEGIRKGTPGYAKEELVAELSSMFMATKLGLETSFENSANYISGWGLRLALQENPKILFEAAREAEKAVEFLVNDELMEKVDSIRSKYGFNVDFSDVDAVREEMEANAMPENDAESSSDAAQAPNMV